MVHTFHRLISSLLSRSKQEHTSPVEGYVFQGGSLRLQKGSLFELAGEVYRKGYRTVGNIEGRLLLAFYAPNGWHIVYQDGYSLSYAGKPFDMQALLKVLKLRQEQDK